MSLRALPLLPARDLLSAAVWAAGLLTRRVVWRGDVFEVDRSGRLLPVATEATGRGPAPAWEAAMVPPLDGQEQLAPPTGVALASARPRASASHSPRRWLSGRGRAE